MEYAIISGIELFLRLVLESNVSKRDPVLLLLPEKVLIDMVLTEDDLVESLPMLLFVSFLSDVLEQELFL